MKNFIAQGNFITVPTEELGLGETIVGGRGYVLGGRLFGVATTTVEVREIGQGLDCTLALTGVYDLPKAPSQAWYVGARVYWDGAAGQATTTETECYIGIAVLATGATAAEITGRVRLNGIAV